VQEYLKRGNASEAYRRAYPRSKAWKPQVVHQRASELLHKGEVAVRIQELRSQADRSAIATQEEVSGIMTRLVRGAVSDVLRPDGTFDIKKLRACRQELGEVAFEDTKEGGRRVRVKFRDPIAAADRLAKLQGWDKPQEVKLTGTLDVDRERTREAFRAMSPEDRAAWLSQSPKPT